MKKFNPKTPTLRKKTVISFKDEITATSPEKSLTVGKKRISARGRNGITVRRRGGGHKRLYRIIDFKRNKYDIDARIISIEYDPNRSANIALIQYVDGEKRYILAPLGIKVGDVIKSSRVNKLKIATGNCMLLDYIPMGTQIHNIELTKGKGGQIVRSAGTAAQIVAKDGDYCQIRMPSKEIRLVRKDCLATIGRIGNIDLSNVKIGKAGRSRFIGKRPKVRGVVMNPVDHPMGGGEGRTSGGRHPCTPWGKPTKGYKTRKKNNPTSKYIIKRRGK